MMMCNVLGTLHLGLYAYFVRSGQTGYKKWTDDAEEESGAPTANGVVESDADEEETKDQKRKKKKSKSKKAKVSEDEEEVVEDEEEEHREKEEKKSKKRKKDKGKASVEEAEEVSVPSTVRVLSENPV